MNSSEISDTWSHDKPASWSLIGSFSSITWQVQTLKCSSMSLNGFQSIKFQFLFLIAPSSVRRKPACTYFWWFIYLKLWNLWNFFCPRIPKWVLNWANLWAPYRIAIDKWFFSDCYWWGRKCTSGFIFGKMTGQSWSAILEKTFWGIELCCPSIRCDQDTSSADPRTLTIESNFGALLFQNFRQIFRFLQLYYSGRWKSSRG